MLLIIRFTIILYTTKKIAAFKTIMLLSNHLEFLFYTYWKGF